MDTARQAREWLACADACWAAARHLPDQEGRFQLPRLRLAGLAVEYRLRAFICLSRRGTPDSHDLGHLLRLRDEQLHLLRVGGVRQQFADLARRLPRRRQF